MNGGGAGEDSFQLGDISNYREIDDIPPILSASLVGMSLALIGGRLGNLGGFSLNAYFDAFGLEGFLANSSLIVLLFQITRWVYTSFYNADGSRQWSPIVFVSILLFLQLLHDIIFYYGLIQQLPSGKNEMIDMLKRYAAENGARAVGGHSFFLAVIALIAMFLKESTPIFGFLVVSVTLYLLPFVITTLSPKPAPPPAPPAERTNVQARPGPQRDPFEMPRWAGGGGTSLGGGLPF